MPFEFYEKSAFEGVPIELYQFTLDGVVYRYTSSDFALNDGVNVWASENIRRENISQSQEQSRNDLELQVSQDFVIARAFIGTVTRQPIPMIIYRRHRVDTESRAIWNGQVRAASYKDEEASLFCETILSSVSRQGLDKVFGRSCNHFLYDAGCKLNPENFASTVTVTGISGDATTFTLTGSFNTGTEFYSAGFIKRLSNNDMRLITFHAGTVISILTPFPGVQLNEQFRIYKGCKRDIPSCKSFQNLSNPSLTNIENMLAFPYTPTDNVFVTGLK